MSIPEKTDQTVRQNGAGAFFRRALAAVTHNWGWKLGCLVAAILLWGGLIMQDGTIRADVTRSELDASGRTLEELFFDVTENLSREDMSHPDAGTAEGEAAAQEGKMA